MIHTEKNCIVASVIIFNDKGKTLLIKHKKLGVWIYPGGHVEENELPDRAALREVLEETGLKVRLIDAATDRTPFSSPNEKRMEQPLMIMFEDVPYKTGQHNHFDLVYIAEVLGGNEIERISDESEEMGWFGEDEIGKLDIRFKGIVYAIHEAFGAYKKIKRRSQSKRIA